MRPWERLQAGLAHFGDVGQAFTDAVSSAFGEDDRTVGEYFSLAGLALGHSVAGVGQVGAALLGPVGDHAEAGVEAIGAASEFAVDKATFLPRVYQSALNLSNSSTWAQQQGYDTSRTGAFAENGPGGGGSQISQYQALMDSDTWDKAWDIAKTTSLGQAGWRGFMWDGQQVDIMDKNAVQKLQDDPLFNVASGLTDAAATWYADPLAIAGKAISVYKKTDKGFTVGLDQDATWLEKQLRQSGVAGSRHTDPDDYARNDPELQEFYAWADGRPAREILQHPMIADSTRSDDFSAVIAGLFDREDRHSIELVMAASNGSKRAFESLVQTNSNLAFRVSQVREMTHPQLEAELNRRILANEFVADEDALIGAKMIKMRKTKNYHKRLREDLEQHDENQLRIYRAIVGQSDTESGLYGSALHRRARSQDIDKAYRNIAYDDNKLGDYLAAARPISRIVQGKMGSIPIKAITYFPFKVAQGFTNKRPPSWIDPNRADSSAGLNAYMRHAGVLNDSQQANYMEKYLRALGIQERKLVVEEVEKEAIGRIAAKYGVSGDFAKILADSSLGLRNSLVMKIRDAQKSGKRDVMGFDGDGNKIYWNTHETQETNRFPLLDLKNFERQLAKHQGGITALMWHGTGALKDNAFTIFNALWTPMQLLRAGYGVRNITEGTLRLLATMGAMTIANMASHGAKAGLGDAAATRVMNLPKHINRGFRKGQSSYHWTMQFVTDPIRHRDAREAVLEKFDKAGRDLGSVKTQMDYRMTFTDRTLGTNVAYERPMSGRQQVYKVLASASYKNLLGHRDSLLTQLRNRTKSHEIISGGERGHLEMWADIINNTLGKSELTAQFMAGKTRDEVVEWLKRDRVGQNVYRRVGQKSKNVKVSPEDITDDAMHMFEDIIPLLKGHQPGLLRDLAYKGEVTPAALERLFPLADDRPQLWNAQIGFALRDNEIRTVWENIVNGAFKAIATQPENKLVRNPAFRQMLIGNIRMMHHNLVKQLPPGTTPTNIDMYRITHQAHEMTLQAQKKLFYDGDSTSNIAHKFRMMTGFMSAWEDSIFKWGRIIVDNPQVLVQGGKLWNAPNEMSLGATVNPDTGETVPRFHVIRPKKNDDGTDSAEWEELGPEWDLSRMNEGAQIEIRLPEDFRKQLPGDPEATWRISKGSLNLVLQGDKWWLPSVGPLAQIPINELAARHPVALPEVYKWALPFGVEENTMKAMLPAYARRQYESAEGIKDPSYAFAFATIAQTEFTRADLQERNRPTYDEIKERTDALFNVRTFVNFFAPFTAQQTSPFQYFIDEYRKMSEQMEGKTGPDGRPMNADDEFYTKYGDDLYLMTMSLSKNNTGLPASKRAWLLSEENRKLIAEDPEMSRLWLSDLDNGTYDQYVYGAQFFQEFSDHDWMTARERRTPMQAIEDNEREEGWVEYTQIADYLTGEMEKPGADRKFLEFSISYWAKKIADQNEVFREDFYKTDPNKIPDRIVKMEKMVQDPSISERDEIKALNRYLNVRRDFIGILDQLKSERRPYTLQANENAPIANAWDKFKLQMAESDTRFSRIYWRYLSYDRLQRSSTEAVTTDNPKP